MPCFFDIGVKEVRLTSTQQISILQNDLAMKQGRIVRYLIAKDEFEKLHGSIIHENIQVDFRNKTRNCE